MREAAKPGSQIIAVLALISCALVYIVGRIAALFLAESYALYAFGVVALYAMMGFQGLRKAVFPLAFLAFSAPVPFAVNWSATVALRLWISELTVWTLQLFNVQSAREGLTLYLASYKIEIEQACSGMNSLVALSALGLCYAHLRRDPPAWYMLLLLPFVTIYAVVANFLRVLLLAVMTLTLGDALAQGVLHQTLGILTFIVALALTFVTDSLLAGVLGRRAMKR